jgi:aminopeptidase N
MKRIFSSFAFLMLLCGVAAAQRLPELAVPENYQLSFAPDFQKDNFAGEETIQVRVLKATSQIVLSSVEIEFLETTISSGGASQKANVSVDKEKEMATLSFGTEIQPGPVTIHIKYVGTLNDELRGLYLGKDKNRKYAVTQFEATTRGALFHRLTNPPTRRPSISQ